MSSFLRPSMTRKPSAVRWPRSPVASQPSWNGWATPASTYPWVTWGPRTRISPSAAMRTCGLGQRLADGADAVAAEAVQGDQGRLAEPVGVVDLDPQLAQAAEQLGG